MSSKKRNKKDDSSKESINKKSNASTNNSSDDKNDDENTNNESDQVIRSLIFPLLFGIGNSDDNNQQNNIPPYKSKQTILKERILESKMDDKDKEQVLQRLLHINGDKQKHIEWFESLLRIPFGNYVPIPISNINSREEITNYFSNVQSILDKAVHGMNEVKEEIINYVSQVISTNNQTSPRVIGLQGVAGCGKTAIIRRGLSYALNRPMKSFSCGGQRDLATTLIGFEHCYSGSKYGRIVQSLIETECMNPIFFFDELDKISTSGDGADITNLLIHLTDPTQNYDFSDKYFSGIRIDLSKVIFVFSYNDSLLIHPILKDRIYEIRVSPPTEEEKIMIGKNYLLKEISFNIGFKDEDIICPDEIIKFIIREYCKKDKGVRPLKQCIETLLMKLNTARYILNSKYKTIPSYVTLPYTLTQSVVEELLKKKETGEEFISHLSMYL